MGIFKRYETVGIKQETHFNRQDTGIMMKVHTIAFGMLSTIAAATAQAAPVCSTAELFAGNPSYEDPMDRASDGQGLLDNPPLAWRSLILIDDKLVTHVGQEIWYTDLKERKPVVKRLAGREDRTGRSIKPGTCPYARFANIHGIAVNSSGNIVGADQTGNNIFSIKDPFGANCTVTFLAGSTKAIESISPGNPPNVGDIDGPGASARFGLVTWPAIVADNIYFIDEHHRKLKRVTNDSDNTVKTIATLPEGVYYALVGLKDRLYTVGNSMSEGFIIEIEPETGAMKDIVRGRSPTFGGQAGKSLDISGLATDGKGLFTSNRGQLLYVTIEGKITSIAGDGTTFEFRRPYDPTRPQKADSVQLVASRRTATAGSNVFLAYKDNAVYYSATAPTSYIERIACK